LNIFEYRCNLFDHVGKPIVIIISAISFVLNAIYYNIINSSVISRIVQIYIITIDSY